MNVPRSGLLQGLINNNKSSSTKREHELAHRRSIQVHTVEPTDGQTSGKNKNKNNNRKKEGIISTFWAERENGNESVE